MSIKKNLATGAVCLTLLATTTVGMIGWYTEHQRANRLSTQVAELELQEKRSAVVRSVSKQMEEIAYQQKEISDEQREEAIQQKRVADEMRQRSEVERMNALIAQEQAVASERQAQDARQVAENQRLIAEHQRLQAELSKRITDTLSYVALARSLGSLSSIQSQLGNTELAELLAYSSYRFANRYKADIYYPAIFQSLLTASQSKRTWSVHRGSLMKVVPYSARGNSLVTVSSYGEIIRLRKEDDKIGSDQLFSNKDYDFRDVFTSGDTIYAVSRTGHLVIFEHDVPRVLPVNNLANPIGITPLDDHSLLLTGENGLAVYDVQRKIIVAWRELDFRITCTSRYNNHPIIFDDKGRQHLVTDINELLTTNIPFSGRVTAFASSKSTKRQAYGLSDGTIYLLDENTGKVTKLQGHLSRISKLKLNGHRLYSSSYDGTVKMWNTESEKIEAMTMISAGSWIMDFNFDNSKQYVLIGDQNGNLTEALLSVPMMVRLISSHLKRDFTPEEWNYYIGKNIPYESIIGKEVAP